MRDDRTDALFPQPHSPAGKLLAHLVGRQIPGTPIDTTMAGVARAAGLRPSEATAALAKLAEEGLVLVEPAASGDAATITVLLAPPLDEYGIKPGWVEGDAPSAAVSPFAPPLPDTPDRVVAGPIALASVASVTTAAPESSVEPPARKKTAPAGAGRTAGGPGSKRGAEAPAGAPAATAQLLPLPDASDTLVRGPARRGGEPATVDETALVRGFVDRFERLLAEIDEWKRRAQSAEEHAAATEKLLRNAERRAETAEARLAEAQERLRTWAELTRRMQQLSRQADGRSRAPSTRRASSGTATSQVGGEAPGDGVSG